MMIRETYKDGKFEGEFLNGIKMEIKNQKGFQKWYRYLNKKMERRWFSEGMM